MTDIKSDEKHLSEIPLWAKNMDPRHYGNMLILCRYEIYISKKLKSIAPYALGAIFFSSVGFFSKLSSGNPGPLHWTIAALTSGMFVWLLWNILIIRGCRKNLHKLMLQGQLLPEKKPNTDFLSPPFQLDAEGLLAQRLYGIYPPTNSSKCESQK